MVRTAPRVAVGAIRAFGSVLGMYDHVDAEHLAAALKGLIGRGATPRRVIKQSQLCSLIAEHGALPDQSVGQAIVSRLGEATNALDPPMGDAVKVLLGLVRPWSDRTAPARRDE